MMRIDGVADTGRSKFRAVLCLAFGGIAVILMTAVGLALYTSDQLGQAVERTTHEVLPETLAALRLSERSALLVALAPALANASDREQSQRLADQLDGLVREIDAHIARLNVRIDPNTIAILRDRVAFLATTLQTLKAANANRIALNNQQAAMLAEIGTLHGEMNDIVSPVVYGVNSLNQLLTKRLVRQQATTMRGLQEQRVQQILAIMELRLLLDRLTAARRNHGKNGVNLRQDEIEPIRAAFDRLRSAQGDGQDQRFAQLAVVAERFLRRKPPLQWSETSDREFGTALDSYLEWLKPHLAKELQEELDQTQSTVLASIEQMARNMGHALDIRGEGNLLFAVLAAVTEVNDVDNLVVLRERFKRSHDIFWIAVETFRTSELARRNPVLADNVANIEKRLAAFGEGERSMFAVRQDILNLNDQIQRWLADSRRIVKAVTDQIDELVGRVQTDIEVLQTALATRQHALTWWLAWVCGGGLLLAGLIAYWTGRVLDRHERDLRAAKATADRAHEAKSRFLANMSHEIRTPMNGVLGMLDLLERTTVDSRQRGYLEMARSSAGKLLTVINDILDVSKLEAGRLTMERIEFDLRRQVEEVATLLASEARRKGLDMVCAVAEQAPRRVRGDPTRLHQVLTNLLGNAIKFTERGEVEVRVEPVEDGRLRFAIRDTGVGMTEVEQAQVFDAFVQADGSTTRKFGGTGLGLTISRQLVTLMGGTLTVRSAPGQGSELSFVLSLETVADPPLAPGSAAPPNRAADDPAVDPSRNDQEADLSRQGKRVLLVEDNLVNQLLCQEMLAQLGLSVVVADNGREALAALAGETFDLVLMDCQMPEMDGYEATRAIRAREQEQNQKHLPIIALTAHAMPSDREKCLAAGMDDYLAKPFQYEQLKELLGRWL